MTQPIATPIATVTPAAPTFIGHAGRAAARSMACKVAILLERHVGGAQARNIVARTIAAKHLAAQV